MIKRFFILLLAIVASVGMSYALTPRSGDEWNESTKVLTVNSNPQDDYYNDQGEILHVVISSSVTEIGEQAFSNNSNLASVFAYDGLQVIDQSAFFSCPKLESVILPSTLQEVRYSAFGYCDNLKYVTINASSLEDYAEYAFDDTHADLKIYVPEASLATYKYFWPAYASKFQAIPSSLAVGDTLKAGDAMYSATNVYVATNSGGKIIRLRGSALHTISTISVSSQNIRVGFTPRAELVGSTGEPNGTYMSWLLCSSDYSSGDVTEITVVSGAGTLADPFVIDYVVPSAPAPAPAATVTWNSSNVSDLKVRSYQSYSKEGVTLSANSDMVEARWQDLGDESMDGINFNANETGGYTFSNTLGKNFTKIEMTLTGPGGWDMANLGSGWSFSWDYMNDKPATVTWTGNAATVDLAKDASDFNGERVKSIVFYFVGGSEEPGGGSADVIPCTAEDLGKVLCTDGSIYATVSEAAAASKTAAAVIAYVDTENGKGLALALADDGGEMEWATAKTTAAAHTPAVSGGTWTLASKDDWNNMITAAGSYTALRDGFSGVGGTNMQQDKYWSSTPVDIYAWIFYFDYGKWVDGYVDDPSYVRACLEFDIPAIPTNKLYMEVDGTAGTLKWGLAESNPVYDGDAIQYSDRKYITTLTIDESCQNHTLTSFYNLFHIFKALTTINGIENLATANVENMSYMFYDCQSLTSLDLSSFNTANVTNMKGMFNGCSNLTTIYVGDDWNTSAVTNGNAMFYGCTNLPNYDSEATGVEKAYVGAGGYLSAMLTPADVMALIAAIGEVEYTAESKAKIDAARAAFIALSDGDKDLVTNYSTLQQAETDYANAKQAADQAAADPVIAKINEIPSPMTTENTKLSVYQKVQDARAAYDALTADQKLLVSNYQTLLDAEAAFAAIGGGGGLPAGALTGAFSINASGDKIVFSKGNLQYVGSWQFATNQWDAFATDQSDDHRDLFGWGTKNNPNNVSTENSDYTWAEWGENAISNGGDQANAGWRTLTNDEWTFLLNTRSAATRFAKAYLFGTTHGLILFPDNYSHPAGLAEIAGINSTASASWNGNQYSAADWTKMEAAGAVFLPLTGYRSGTSISEATEAGEYWTSTPSPSNTEFSYYLYFSDAYLSTYTYGNRVGNAVRLVISADAAGGSAIDDAQAALALINAIPDPVVYPDSKPAIDAARAALNALSDEAKSLFVEADTIKLPNAEAEYAQKLAEAVAEVVAKIAALPDTPLTPENTKLSVYDKVEEARAAFNALTAEEKAAVTNIDKLEAIEAAFAAIGGGAGPEELLTTITVDAGEVNYTVADVVNLDQSGASLGQDGWTSGTVAVSAKEGYTITKIEYLLSAGMFGVGGSDTEAPFEITIGSGKTLTKIEVYGYASASPIAAAQAAVALINAIPTPAELTPECLNAVKAAREAVDALGEAASLIDASDLQKLLDAEAVVGNVLNVWISGDCRVILWKDSTMNVQKLPGDGNGAMADYSYVSRAPWYNSHWYSPEPGQIVVTSLTIEEGVTSLTEDAFGWMDGLKTVTIPASVTSIHRDAFYWSKAIDDIYLTADTANLTWGDHGDTSFKPEKATRCHVPSDLLEAYQAKFTEINVTFVGDLAPVDPAAGAAAIVDLINAIGTVEYTDECKAKIDAAREAYDKAVDVVKDLISADDLKKLTDAETEYADLKAAADQTAAAPVIAKINNIPQPVELKLATRDSIESARAAYDALTADQQALVNNYQTLLDAEAALAEKNQGGSVPMDIVWDGNTGIANVDPNTTSPAYEGMTVTVGNGSSFSTYQNRLYFTFYSQPNGGYIFANADGSNITKVVIESTTALTSTMTEVDRMGSGWVISNENKTATWTGNADSVSIWKGQSFTNYWVVDTITFTVNGVGATPLDQAQAVKDLIDAIPAEITLEDACVNAVQAARDAYNALSEAAQGALDAATVNKLNQAIADYTALIQAGADEVIAKINAIPTQIELLISTKHAIDDARAAYDALTADQQALVSNYQKLTDAEDAWAQIYAGHEDEMVQAEAVAALIEAIPDPVVLTSECENAINLANDAFSQLSDEQKAMLGEPLVQKLTDAVATYKVLADQDAADAVIARIDAIPSPVVYSAECKEAISDARAAYDALSDEAKALVSADELKKLTDAEAAYAALAAEREANVAFLGKEQTVLYEETIALTKLPNGAPDENGWAFDHWEVMPTPMYAGLHLQAVYRYLITLKPQAYDTLMYSGLAQTLIAAGEAEEGHLEYRIGEGAWDATLPQATDAGTYAIQYKLVRTGHEDFIAPDTVYAQIAKAPVAYTAPVAYDTLVYNYGQQTLVLAGQTNDGTFEYTLTPSNENSWSANLPQGTDAGAYSVYFRVNGDMNHLDSVATDPVTATIAKRDIVVTAPVAYDTLVYNALAQTLAADATADFGTLQYTLTKDDSESWQTTMAQGTNAGAYTVYYRVPGDNNHNDFETDSITVSIAKAPLTITANDSTIIYADAVPEFEASYSGWHGQDGVELVSGLQFATTYEVGSYVGTYDIVPSGATADNYTMTYVNGTLTVTPTVVYVSDAEAQIAKFADGHANAVVLKQGTLNGIKLNDPIAHVTTAAFSSADVAENLTITLFYELTGDAALLNNYNLDPTSDIFTNEGVIIEPFIPDNEEKPEDEEAKVNEGIEIYAYGYCDGSGYSLKYHLESGNPDQYKIDFADSRFTDVDWTNLVITGKDGTIDIEIPVDLPTGDYTMTVYFRDSRFDWLESRQFNVTFHVNLPETYVRPLFDNVIALVDTCHCLTDIQWYWRANSSELWQPIEGANGYYYHVDGKLTGEYFVSAKMNGEPTYTCGQADMETLYGAGQQAEAPVVRAYPNPVVNSTTVTIENSIEWIHNIRIVNLMGVEVMNTTFEGNETNVEMSAYPQGNYMISVDGIVVKVMKK